MPFPFSHSRSPRPLPWKDALQWVPPWSLGQPAAPLPGVQGTRAQLSPSGLGLGDPSLNWRRDENPVLPREQSEGMFQPGRGNLPGVEMLESPHRLGILASIHAFIFRPAIFFPLNRRDSIQEEIITPRNRILRVPRQCPFPQSALGEPHAPVSDVPGSPLGFSFSPGGLGHPC